MKKESSIPTETEVFDYIADMASQLAELAAAHGASLCAQQLSIAQALAGRFAAQLHLQEKPPPLAQSV